MATTWTKYRLSNAQLKILANLDAGNPHGHGMAISALKRKRLVEANMGGSYPHRCCTLLDKGKRALELARDEGW